MRHAWIRIITAAIFLMAQVTGAAVSSSSCVQEKEVRACHQACCSGTACECSMAPSKAPARPAPMAPVPHFQEIKFTPILTSVMVPRFSPLVSQKPPRPLPADAFLPHCPPALALHCTLLI
jgi:hypothetical protein